jgi:16S rRNA (cytidine1402-2'-O)-methyltransferase
MNKPTPKLYLIPTPIGTGTPVNTIPPETIRIIQKIQHFLVENTRTARRFLRDAGYLMNFDEVWFYEINEHNQHEITKEWISPLFGGHDLGLMSEAGIPCVADPGSAVVKLCHEFDFPVIPLSGTSSIFKALMASGFDGQQFTFHGYLPVKKEELKQRLKKIEENMYQHGYTQIFMETPYRNERLFETILSTLKNQTMLCIACSIDSPDMMIKTKSVVQWKSDKPTLKNIPAVFLIGRG